VSTTSTAPRTAATPASDGTKVLRRRQGLAPYLEIVEDALEHSAHGDASPREGFPQAPAVALDPWAVGWLRTNPVEGPQQLPELLRQTLAFLIKVATDSARLKEEEPRSGNDFFAAQAELMLDSAVGMALKREIQKVVNELISAGAVNDARQLARLQGRVRTTVRELKQSIAESNRGRDEALVEQLTDEVERTTPAAAEPRAPARAAWVEETPEAAPAPARPKKPRVPVSVVTARPSLRTTILLVLIGSGLGSWLALRAFTGWGRNDTRILTRSDFVRTAPIRQVIARPPSAYVVVDELTWLSFDEGQQLRLVESMAAVVARHGYWGMVVHTSDGMPAAQWLEERGSRLLRDAPALVTPKAPDGANYDRFVP